MAFEDLGRAPGGGPKPNASSVRIVPARGRVATNAEVHVEGEWLQVTFAAPDIPKERFRIRLGKRYLLVWADESPHGQHHFVILPRPVQPRQHEVQFVNGVVDLRARLASP